MGFKVVFEQDEEERVKVIKIPIELKKPFGKPKKHVEGELVLEWEKALGYRENPFKGEILEPAGKYAVNFENEKEKVNLFIISDKKFGTIIGEKGTGKTIFLKWLEEQLEKFKYKVVVKYMDWSGVKTNTKFVKELFKPSSGFKGLSEKGLSEIEVENFDKKLKESIRDKKYVLLIDNLQKLTKERFLVLDTLIAMNTQIIIAGDKELMNSIDSIRGWLDDRGIRFVDDLKIKLEGISLKGAKEMIAKRIAKVGGKSFYPFDEELLKKIWLKGKRNPVKIMELCNDYAIELSVKKSEGLKVEDIRSYQKDGIKLEKAEVEDDFFESEEQDVKGKDYKIKVINKSEYVVMEEEESKDKKKYVIKGKKK
ncbi:MAG: AAA family ATPase [archaeon]